MQQQIPVRKVLGGHVCEAQGQRHCIAKLSNGEYAIGNLNRGDYVDSGDTIKNFDEAFAKWYDDLCRGHIPRKSALHGLKGVRLV